MKSVIVSAVAITSAVTLKTEGEESHEDVTELCSNNDDCPYPKYCWNVIFFKYCRLSKYDGVG